MNPDEKKLIVFKSNPLLDMKNEMGLYQQRMFNLYLAAINPMKEDTKKVSFTLSEFVRLIGITEINPKKLHALARDSVRMYVDLYAIEEKSGKKKADSNRMNYVNVWKRFKVDKDESGQWTVELQAGDDVLPYMFEIKSLGYLNFPVIFALRMRSPIAEKLYEQCARYKDKKSFTISPEELKKRLGIANKESYKSYNRLKTSVLNRCMKEINEKTDIYVAIVDEERLRKRGKPVKSITFSVEANPAFKQRKEDGEIQALHEKSMPIDVEMTPVDATADRQLTLEAYELQQSYGFSDVEAETIIRDRDKYGLSDDRVREVIDYVIAQKPQNRMAYIRSMLRKPDADLVIVTEAGKQAARNPFNQFEQNSYDFDELEEQLLSNGLDVLTENEPTSDKGQGENGAEEVPGKGPEDVRDTLPPYYIVMGDPDVPKRLAAYQALGIPGEKIKILTMEEYERLK